MFTNAQGYPVTEGDVENVWRVARVQTGKAIYRRREQDCEADDLLGIALGGGWKALLTFDPRRSVSLRTHTWNGVKWALMNRSKEAGFWGRNYRNWFEQEARPARRRRLAAGVSPEHAEEPVPPWMQHPLSYEALFDSAAADEDRWENHLAADTDIEAEVIAADERDRLETTVQAGLRRLQPKVARAIRLRFWEGLTFAEIGEQIGVSRTAVYNYVRQGQRALAQFLVAEGIGVR